MTQYIDKDALEEEIERRQKILDIDSPFGIGGMIELELVKDILNTLEVKEVDLGKELVYYHNENFSPCNDGTLLSCETGSELTWYDYERIAKHFFELGMLVSNKAQKGNNMTQEEKAKAYDEAIKIAKSKIKNNKDHVLYEDDIIEIFPELKESEDEKVRKTLIHIVKCACDKYGVKYQGKEISEDKLLAWLEKQGEQKTTNNVEPKFKVGDWITDGIDVDKIIGIDLEDEDYLFENDRKSDISLVESISHLWTIQDARDGDVLATKDIVFIFKHMDKTGLSLCKSYCEVVGNSKLGLGFDFSISGVHPATKEQRDLLFQKMKEAGYKWDSEKKELKKIEQKPDFCHHEVDFSDCSEEYRKAYYDGWNNCNQQHSQLKAEQKPVWSEEDEEMFNTLIVEGDLIQSEIDWLKSLKDRMKGE